MAFYVSSAVIAVCAGLMSACVLMLRKKASRSRFVMDVASWLRRLVRSLSGQGSTEAPGPSVPDRLRFAPSRHVGLECSSSNEEGESLVQKERERESCADFREVSLQILDPSEWRLAAYGGFFRDENFILEARSTLYAVWYAEGKYPPGHLLILSDNLALVLALCTGRSNQITLLSVLRRIFASCFQAGFVLSFRWVPSELKFSDKGGRFFDRDHDTSKSLLHVDTA